MKLLKNKFSFKDGFTLIELLIVVAIVGIIVAAVAIAINPIEKISAARNAMVRSNLIEAGKAAGLFNEKTNLSGACTSGGSYPKRFGQSVCNNTVTYIDAPEPSNRYRFYAIPANCNGNTIPCTEISISGPAYSDGVVDASIVEFWCWKSVTGRITQVQSNLNLQDNSDGNSTTYCSPIEGAL